MSKKTKRRDCAFLGKTITSADCGANRHSTYDCPVSCPHSPYHPDNYEQALAIEERVDSITLKTVTGDPHILHSAKQALNATSTGFEDASNQMTSLFFYETGEDGLSFGERWEQSGYSGLKNDEVVLIRAKRKVVPALLEVQTVIDDQSMTCINLLDEAPQPFTVLDRSFAAVACRFQRMFGFIYTTPGYARAHGSITELKPHPIGPVESLKALVTHLGGECSNDWMGRNFSKISRSILALNRERQRLTLQQSDYQSSKIDYELAEFVDKFSRRLEKAGCIEDRLEDAEVSEGFQKAYLWPDTISKDVLTQSLDGTPYLGAILLKPGGARIQATRSDFQAALRTAFEKAAGKKARFVRELVQDHAAHTAAQMPSTDSDLVPPSLLEDVGGIITASSQLPIPDEETDIPSSMQEMLDRYYRKLLDEPMPALEDLTPQQAASDFLVRPKLIEWVKGLALTTDRQNLDTGATIDINWIIKELNLSEIDFPAPPRRETQYGATNQLQDGDFAEKKLDALHELISSRLDEFLTAGVAMDEMESHGCNLIDDMFECTEDYIDEEFYDILIPILIMAWLGAIPKGLKLLWPEDLCDNALANIFSKIHDKSNDFSDEKFEGLCDFPDLSILLLGRLQEVIDTLPRKEQPSPNAQGGMVFVLIAALNALHESLSISRR